MNGGFDDSNTQGTPNGQTKEVAGGRYKLTLQSNGTLTIQDTRSGQTIDLAPNQADTRQVFHEANKQKVESLINGPAGGGQFL